MRSVRAAIAALVFIVACTAPPLESPPPSNACQKPQTIALGSRNKVDVLFMVDNSKSMAPMSSELQNRFGQFLKAFENLAANKTFADLNIGVVTSDYGAGATGVTGSCDPSPGGQRGRLQALGVAAANGCQAPRGANFIHYNFASGGTDNNLPAGQNLLQTFTCMASVGANGCGFEHQLESVYAALHDNVPENRGFMRPDAYLAVVFLTNEDDSSAPPDTDMFDATRTAQYGALTTYRQTRFGVECDGALTPYADSAGPLANCVAARNPPGHEFDVQRYVDFFTKPASQGGVKASPGDVILVGIDAPESPVQIILADPDTPPGTPYRQCPALVEQGTARCLPALQHSCQNPHRPAFFGDPAVRLNTVIRAARNHQVSSICDEDYSGTLQKVASLITNVLHSNCLQSAAVVPGLPDCVVEEVSDNGDGTSSTAEVSSCDRSGGTPPCWRTEKQDSCATSSPDSLALIVERGGAQPPTGATLRLSCNARCE